MTLIRMATCGALFLFCATAFALDDMADGVAHEFTSVTNKELLDQGFVDSVRRVRTEIVEAAKRSKRVGDERTEEIVQAAKIGISLPQNFRARAILLALAVTFDQRSDLRKSIITERFWRAYETDEERQERLRVFGEPTICGRKDLAEHFFIGAGLTAIGNPSAAEAACILKEVSDSNGGSGFSFAELGAGLAGIIYAEEMICSDSIDPRFVESFDGDLFVPSFSDLPEGVMIDELRKDFTLNSKNKFKAEVRKIQQRVLALPIYESGSITISSDQKPDELSRSATTTRSESIPGRQ